jgi:hypothetical protein
MVAKRRQRRRAGPFVGWLRCWRRFKGRRWLKAVEAANESTCWNRLLSIPVVGDSDAVVLEAGRSPTTALREPRRARAKLTSF